MTDAQVTGERIAYHRKRMGLSQAEFAARISRSDSWVSQVERGVRAVDRISVLQTVADALSVPVSELRDGEPDDAAGSERPEAFEALRLALTGHPAIGTIIGAEPGELTREGLDRLAERHAQIWPLVHASRYSELAPLVTGLVPALEQATRAGASPELTRAARELLTDTYQAIAAATAKIGETDAAWVAADRAAFVAESVGDPLVVAASLFRMAHAFLTMGHIAQAQEVASAVASCLDEQRGRGKPSVPALSLEGAFHLVLAIAAARDNDRIQAVQHIDQARDIASLIGEDRDDFGTEFGPTNVALHAVAVAVELGDAGQAIELSRQIQPGQLSPERQARYDIDLAQAHAMRRQIGEALRCLEEAERLTPEQTRTHRVARAVARDLIQLSGSRPRPELRELAERFGMLP
jgi:transcriptional regulator with XRE-family HTH domain